MKPSASISPSLRDEWIDPDTGHRVVRLSRLPGSSESFYFHQNAFTPEGDKMVFANTTIGATNRLFVLDWATRKLAPLTEPGAAGAVVARHSRHVYYQRKTSLYRTDIDTHETKLLAQLPPRVHAGTINADETLAAGTFLEPGTPDIDTSGPKSEWFDKVYDAKRPQHLFTLDLATGKTNVFYRYEGWLGHIQFSPADPTLLMFCHEGPWHKLDRIWNIRTDGTQLRLLHKRSVPMEIAGHEFWSPDGKTVWFDLQVPRGEKFFLAGVDIASGNETRYALERDQWSVHYNVTRDGKLFAGDGGGPKNVAHASNGQWLWLFTPQADGTFHAEHLVNMAKHDYLLEPNVNFTPDGKWIVFRGNFDGSPQVYAVEVAKASGGSSVGQTLAFPGAEGFGAVSTGGRGGEIYHVTNLGDSGTGSFREAVSRSHRVVVFDVGGVIKLASNVSASSDLTILGQSAPGQGIALYGRSVSFSGCSNDIVRYLRFREGISGDKGKCAINLSGGGNMIFDHVSIQWGRWDCLGVTKGSHDITFQYCLIGEGLDPQRFGALVDSVTNITLSHNLWLNNQSRNPKAKGTIEYINNVVYNWGVNGLVGGHSAAPHELDVVGNYFIKGPSSNNRPLGMFTATDNVFQKDNYADLNCDGALNGRLVLNADFGDGDGAPTFSAHRFVHPAVPVTVDSAEAAYQKVLAGAGCSLHRDSVDARLVAAVASLGKEARIIRDEAEAGGIGELAGGACAPSTTGDGISDQWKLAHGLDPKDPNLARADYDHDGYMNLEKFLNETVR